MVHHNIKVFPLLRRFLSIIQSSLMSVCPSFCLSLKISVTTEPIGFYSSGNIPTGPVVVQAIFLGAGTPSTPQKTKIPHPFFQVRCSSRQPVAVQFYSSGNIPTGPGVILGYFLGGFTQQKIPHFIFLGTLQQQVACSSPISF